MGRATLRTEDTVFKLADYTNFLNENAESIAAFRDTQRRAFAEERDRWEAAGLAAVAVEKEDVTADESMVPEGCEGVASPLTGNVLRVLVQEGDTVVAGQTVAVLESMKMEFPAEAVSAGTVRSIRCRQGAVAQGGQWLVWIEVES